MTSHRTVFYSIARHPVHYSSTIQPASVAVSLSYHPERLPWQTAGAGRRPRGSRLMDGRKTQVFILQPIRFTRMSPVRGKANSRPWRRSIHAAPAVVNQSMGVYGRLGLDSDLIFYVLEPHRSIVNLTRHWLCPPWRTFPITPEVLEISI